MTVDAAQTPSSVYVMYLVLGVRPGELADDVRQSATAEVEDLFAELAGKGVTTRGVYEVSGFRPDADLLVWWIAPHAEDLQEAYHRLRRTALGRVSRPTWTAIGVHREAEFNKAHIPAFLAGEAPKRYLCVYPYNRDHEWYLLDAADRADMLAEHGRMGREYPDVLANTVSAFALGDYEFLLAFEADELHRLVDMMRHLRGARARRHTALETPFFTGPRKPVADILADLP
ncbi:MAG: chlorite dismutase family protein [Acidothermus sp.]|nr:chlorite dismutase family protein [Acidothermus sp.]MCL6537126.1 chlorite dismutase family protein [Acidothermus sp.]